MSNFFTIIGHVRTGLSGEKFAHHMLGPYMSGEEILDVAGVKRENGAAATLAGALDILNGDDKVFKAFEDDRGGQGRRDFLAAASELGHGKAAQRLIETIRG